jgi:predicted HTH domain antitoxin
MILEISDHILQQVKLSEKTLRIEIAMLLFQKYHLSFGQARKLSGLNVIDFQKTLAANQIPLHYDVEDFDKDLKKPLK